MPTFKVLSNVLDFLEAKNKEKLPDDEDIEVSRRSMSWKKKLPKVERPEPKEGELRKLECDKYVSVEVTIDRYFDSDRNRWNSYIEVNITTKNSYCECNIPLRGLMRIHPTVLRAKWVFHKIEKACTQDTMLEIDKHLAMANPNRIDDILWGDKTNDGDREDK